jgi:hypothetical protein
MSTSPSIGNAKIQESYDAALEGRLSKVNKRASDAINSFSALVSELNKLSNETTGTTAKKEVAGITADMNNSTVMVTRMLEAQLAALHNVVKPDAGEAMPFTG